MLMQNDSTLIFIRQIWIRLHEKSRTQAIQQRRVRVRLFGALRFNRELACYQIGHPPDCAVRIDVLISSLRPDKSGLPGV